MKTLFEQLNSVRSMEEADAIISAHPTLVERKPGDILDQFLLWIEHLKRSATYKKVCDWFVGSKERKPYPKALTEDVDEEARKIDALVDYFVFAADYQQWRNVSPLLPLKQRYLLLKAFYGPIFEIQFADTIFQWAQNAGYPDEYGPAMLMNYFVFGNVYQEPANVSTARAIHIIENRRYVYRLDEILDVIFGHVERDDSFLGEMDASPDQFKAQLKRYFKMHLTPTICIVDPHENMDKMIEDIKDEIGMLRDIYPDPKKSQSAKLLFSEFKPDQFEWPTGNVRMDELKRYLQAYDLKTSGKTNKEIAAVVYPRFAQDSALRRVMRDRQKAARITKNVEAGFFPGDYPN